MRTDIIELPNPWGRRYRITTWPPSGHQPEVHVEVFTAGRARAWRHLAKHGRRARERAAVLKHWAAGSGE